jgi:uncharacterized phage protein gp47/JayE
MPWSTPSLKQIRGFVRDNVQAWLPGADALVPNSVLRVVSDVQGALCFLVLQYLDWLALQLMPDTAEVEWLDRHGQIWLVNADGSTGRKMATPAQGTVSMTGAAGTLVPRGTEFTVANLFYETTEDATLGSTPTAVPTRAIDPGSISNLDPGATMALVSPLPDIDIAVTVITMTGGTDEETDDELRARVLERIRHPPQGGDADDYVEWTLAVPGVTRAWCAPLEMGIGTVTVRFMCDDLRADNGGFPLGADIDAVSAYLDTVRPVAVKDFFVVAPIPAPVNFTISNLSIDSASTRAAIEENVQAMIVGRAAPGATMWRAWVSSAILEAPGVDHFDLTMTDLVMPNPGSMAVLGDIVSQ